MPEKIIGPEYWALGVASNKYGTDGGFSPAQKGHSLDIVQGALAPSRGMEKLQDLNTGQLGVASSVGGTLFALYSTPSAVQTLAIRSQSAYSSDLSTSTGNEYSRFISDFIFGATNYFLSSKSDIAQVTASSNAVTKDWWSSTKGKGALTAFAPHHFTQVGSDIYFNDDNVFNKIEAAETVVEDVLVLPANRRIQTHCQHKGLIYISTTDESGYHPSLLSWDTNASGLLDIDIEAPGLIYTIISYNGSLYCITQKGFYEYNGLGFVKIKDLNGFVYKTGVIQSGGILYLVISNETDAANSVKNIMAFNGKVFYYPFGGDYAINCLGAYQGVLRFVSNVDFNALTVATVPTTSSGKMSTLPIDFIYNSYVDEIIVELADVMVSGSSNTFKIYDEKGTERKELVMSFAVQGASKSVRFTGLAINNLNSITIQSAAFSNPIRRFTVVYRDNRNQPY